MQENAEKIASNLRLAANTLTVDASIRKENKKKEIQEGKLKKTEDKKLKDTKNN